MTEVPRNARQSGVKPRSTCFCSSWRWRRMGYASPAPTQNSLGQEFLQRVDVVIVPAPLEMVVLAF
jgi:hypothetical protein